MAHFNPTEDEIIASLAAINCYLNDLSTAQHETQEATSWQWRVAARLTTQGITPLRTRQRPSWNEVERLRRAGQGIKGIVGL